jgi:uncharacterized protein YkwD
LSLSPTLSAAAKAHSQDMAARNYFDHVGLDGSTFSQRIVAAGYTGNPTAENIFAGGESAAGAFESWVNSPLHNANMLSPNSLAIGVGRAFDAGSDWGWYWTTTFGDTADAACGGPNADGQTANGGNEPAANGTTNGNEPAGDGTTNGNEPAGNGTTNGNEPAGDGTTNGDAPAGDGTTNGNAQDAPAVPVCVDAEELAFLTLVNNYRAENGLGALSLSPALSAAAKAHSQDMAAKNYFEHEGLDGSTFSQRIIAAGYTGNPTAENIFAGDQTAAGAFESWKNSPPHNANMLSPNSLAIGIGRAFDAGSECGWYWTTTFGDTADAACGGPNPDGQANGQDDQTGTGGNGGADTQPGTNTNGTGDNGANTQPGNADPNADGDGDGISDADEVGFFGTNPQAFDTDGGGVGDGDEFFNGTDPLDPNDDNGGNGNGAVDSDGDGISDADEVDFFGTNPQVFDTDGDGVGDGEEFFNGTDPVDPNSF